MIQLHYEYEGKKVTSEFDWECTWDDIADGFVGFLQASGFSVEPADVAWHLMPEEEIERLKQELREELK